MYTALASGADPEEQHLNRAYVWLISSIAALGGLLFGYDWVVIGGAKPFYEVYFHLTTAPLIGWANSCALLGCLTGSILSGVLSYSFGRKRLLFLSGFLFTVSSLGTGWSNTFVGFVSWRIVGGIAIGLASNVSPAYIAEVSPAKWRGRLVSLNQLAIVIGILLAQIVNWLIALPVPDHATSDFIRNSWNGQTGWRLMFVAVAIPSAILCVAALFVPESPRWLLAKGRERAAIGIFERIGGPRYAADAIQEINTATQAAHTKLPCLQSRGFLRLLTIGVTLAVLQQWSGINIIFNYAEEIFRNAGYRMNDLLFNIVITGTVNLVFTIAALKLVDGIGRRWLLLLGCAGIGLSHLLIGLSYYLGLKGLPILVLTLCTVGCYAMSLAPITWVVITEIFPTSFRGAGISISISALWIASFLLTFTFPIFSRALGTAGVFWLYSAICFGGALFVYRSVPETKGKSLEQIETELMAPYTRQ